MSSLYQNRNSESCLPPGDYKYETIMKMIEEKKYKFAVVKTASGRNTPLVGVSDEQYREIVKYSRKHQLHLCLYGSRVVGPRSEQHKRNEVLRYAIPLYSKGRMASLNYDGVSGLHIRKDAIKEYGINSPETSDLTVVVIDPLKRLKDQLETVAMRFIDEIEDLCFTFPIRVYISFKNLTFSSIEEYETFQYRNFLIPNVPKEYSNLFIEKDYRNASKELYAPVI